MSEASAPAAEPSTTTPAQPAPSGEGQTAQATPPAEAGESGEGQTSSAQGKPEPSRSERRKDAVKALREHLEGKAKPADAKPEEAKSEPAEPGADAKQRGPDGKFAAQPGKAPAAQPAQSQAQQPAAPPKPADGELETRLSRAMRELNHQTSESRILGNKLKEAAGDVAKLKEKIDRGKENPLDLLEELGWDYEKLTRAIVDRKVVRRAQRAELPPEVKEKLDKLEAAETERQQERQREQHRQQRERDVGAVGGYLRENAERYPFTAAVDWAAGSIVDATMRAGQTNAEPQLVALERQLMQDTAALLGNERAVKALLASNPKLKETLTSVLGLSTSNQANPAASNGAGKGSADGPRSLSNLPTGQSAPPPDKQNRGQRKRDAVRAWNSELRRQSDG